MKPGVRELELAVVRDRDLDRGLELSSPRRLKVCAGRPVMRPPPLGPRMDWHQPELSKDLHQVAGEEHRRVAPEVLVVVAADLLGEVDAVGTGSCLGLHGGRTT